MKKLFLISASILSLTACVSTELSNQNQPYDASKDARIRLYGQNGRPSYLTVNIDGKKEKVTIGGGLGQAFSSMVGAKSNESIGMPATELSKDPSAHSKFLSGIFFKEFVIPANSEVTVQNEIIPLSRTRDLLWFYCHCRPPKCREIHSVKQNFGSKNLDYFPQGANHASPYCGN